MMMKTTRPLLAAAAALLALNLGACSDEPETPQTENRADLNDETVDDVAPEPTPIATPAPIVEPTTDANASLDLEPEPVTPPDEQMLDDASATGMTARAARDQPTNDEPVSGEIEQK
jgi:hypothetical protein